MRIHQTKRPGHAAVSQLPLTLRIGAIMVVVAGCLLLLNRPSDQAAQARGCSRGLTASEKMTLDKAAMHVQTTTLPAAVSEQQAIQTSQYNLAPGTTDQASAMVCQLALISDANLHPQALGGAAVTNRDVWIIMYRGIGPYSHGSARPSGPRDYYFFIDATSGAWLFSASLEQPPA